MEKGVRSIRNYKTEDIHIRDPFVFADYQRQKYFLFGTTFSDGCGDVEPCFEVFTGEDLINWEGPYVAFYPPKGFWGVRHYWAPEVFHYHDMYYMLASFKGGIGENRGTGILAAKKPEGPYYPHSEGAVTLKNAECLDGTFYVDENHQPWIIFSHEWTELKHGRIKALKLSEDLKRPLNQNAVEILNAADMKWIREFKDPRIEKSGYLTDAPFIYKTLKGTLLLLWSSYSWQGYSKNGAGGYTVAVTRSESGKIEGPWINDDKLLLDCNAGHASVFKDLHGDLKICLHSPDTPHGNERALFLSVKEENDCLAVIKQI